jgi:hypothetical protein
MRKTIVTAIAAFILGAVTTGAIISSAQPAGPSGAQQPTESTPAARGSWMSRGAWMGRGAGMGMGPGQGPEMAQWSGGMLEHHARMRERRRVFALINRADDLKLTPPDVQKMVEAFLLWNGNHTWKVLNVKADGDVIAFDLATADGSIIASYTMDPRTGRPTRIS